MRSKFRYSLENFRGVAIIFVMLSHVMSIQKIGMGGDYFYYIVGDATTWFVFISGYLFYYLEVNKFNYWSYVVKKGKYVLLPYIILSIPVILYGIYSSQHILYGLTPSQYVFWSLMSGGVIVGPMWFIPMITLFFLLTPIFIILSKSKFLYYVSVFSLIFSIFSSRPIYNTNAMLSFLHFFGFYLLGIVAAKDAVLLEKLKTSTKKKIIAIAFFSFFVFGIFFPGFESMPNSFFNGFGKLNYIVLGKLALLVAIFFLFEQFFDRENNVFGYFSKISFGLFFVHGFMSSFFNKMSKNINYCDPIVKALSEIGVVIFVSIVIVFFAKRILKKWSRYVIGC
ncbi:acyltransferase family protein [Janthinobacterium sp. 64]|uniref:acyltransferase family protein n=1 Tax=Janthinobacterium sp. 64 TaxID=2035208 RepID=UPI000C2C1D6D|nr:acyltransferase [Janthinobacterium sp. 64]PKB22442.1 peptidoglycan/LPS O-acetylase OafA/YrhL [Janthinobacterium sp. 64]